MTSEQVNVTRADREAAAKRLERQAGSWEDHPSRYTAQRIREGRLDVHPWVQDYAKHRLAERARIVAWLYESDDPHMMDIADAIERGDHEQGEGR